MRTLLLAALIAVWALAVQAGPLDVRYRALPEYDEENRESPFFLPDSFHSSPERQLRHELELHAQEGGWNLTATASALNQEHGSPQYDRVLNELFLDTRVFEQDVTLGKKVLSWGVGLGFRPLDVIQREPRLDRFMTSPEGVPLLAWQHFDASTEWTIVYANPLRGKDNDPRLDESGAGRMFLTLGNLDLQGVVRFNERNRYEAGAGFARVIGDAWQVHGEALYLNRYERQINPLAGQAGPLLARIDPIATETGDTGLQALLGVTNSYAGGITWSLEIWYDDEAYTAGEWADLIDLIRRQRALLGKPGVPRNAVLGNVGFSSVYFDSRNLVRENAFVRVSYTGERWEPALEGLFTPTDGGWAATARLSYQGDRFRFQARLRRFGGAEGSAYRALPTTGSLLLSLEWSFG